jgi:hypothetical protein
MFRSPQRNAERQRPELAAPHPGYKEHIFKGLQATSARPLFPA